jgi:hypothetical protein
MKYRVYTNNNICKRTGNIFATYFKTKREAVKYASTLTDAIIEHKVATTWVAY